MQAGVVFVTAPRYTKTTHLPPAPTGLPDYTSLDAKVLFEANKILGQIKFEASEISVRIFFFTLTSNKVQAWYDTI